MGPQYSCAQLASEGDSVPMTPNLTIILTGKGLVRTEYRIEELRQTENKAVKDPGIQQESRLLSI